MPKFFFGVLINHCFLGVPIAHWRRRVALVLEISKAGIQLFFQHVDNIVRRIKTYVYKVMFALYFHLLIHFESLTMRLYCLLFVHLYLFVCPRMLRVVVFHIVLVYPDMPGVLINKFWSIDFAFTDKKMKDLPNWVTLKNLVNNGGKRVENFIFNYTFCLCFLKI